MISAWAELDVDPTQHVYRTGCAEAFAAVETPQSYEETQAHHERAIKLTFDNTSYPILG